MNIDLREIFENDPEMLRFLSRMSATRDPQGQPIEWQLKPGQHQYNFWRDPRGWMHCYSPHPATNGKFYAWTYKPIGKGARTGNASRVKLVKLVAFSHRNKARARAYARYQTAAETRPSTGGLAGESEVTK